MTKPEPAMVKLFAVSFAPEFWNTVAKKYRSIQGARSLKMICACWVRNSLYVSRCGFSGETGYNMVSPRTDNKQYKCKLIMMGAEKNELIVHIGGEEDNPWVVYMYVFGIYSGERVSMFLLIAAVWIPKVSRT
jgi:hypothetical protein